MTVFQGTIWAGKSNQPFRSPVLASVDAVVDRWHPHGQLPATFLGRVAHGAINESPVASCTTVRSSSMGHQPLRGRQFVVFQGIVDSFWHTPSLAAFSNFFPELLEAKSKRESMFIALW